MTNKQIYTLIPIGLCLLLISLCVPTNAVNVYTTDLSNAVYKESYFQSMPVNVSGDISHWNVGQEFMLPDIEPNYYIYAGGNSGQICRYNPSDMSLVDTTDFGAVITSVVQDDYFVYVGGLTSFVAKYSKYDMIENSSYETGMDNNLIITLDDNYAYFGGEYGILYKCFKNNMSLESSCVIGNQITAVTQNDNYVYVGTQDSYVYQFYKSNFTHVNSFLYTQIGGTVYCLSLDSNYLYVGGHNSYATPLLILWENNLTEKTKITFGGFDYLNSIVNDDNYIYLADNDNRLIFFYNLNVYSKADFSLVNTIWDYGNIMSLSMDDNYIYGAWHRNLTGESGITQRYLSDLSLYQQSDNSAGDQIYTVSSLQPKQKYYTVHNISIEVLKSTEINEQTNDKLIWMGIWDLHDTLSRRSQYHLIIAYNLVA